MFIEFCWNDLLWLVLDAAAFMAFWVVHRQYRQRIRQTREELASFYARDSFDQDQE